MKIKTEIINVFSHPYENWLTRKADHDEMLDLMGKGFSMHDAYFIKDRLLNTIETHTDAACYMLRQCADNALERHIDSALDSSSEYQALRKLMPESDPDIIKSYQSEFDEKYFHLVDFAINTYGVEIADGQFLFHGGKWSSNENTFITSRPFSTSFCPQVALRNAEWNGKAYDAGRVELMVVRVTVSNTKAYACSRSGDKGNEKEVVFASGAKLTRVKESYICDTTAIKMDFNCRESRRIIPAYMVEVNLS